MALASQEYPVQLLLRDQSKSRDANDEDKQLADYWQPTFSQTVDPDTGYIFYENTLTGQRHWDRPMKGVLPLRPKTPTPEQAAADAARENRQLCELETRRCDMKKRRAVFDKQLKKEANGTAAQEANRVDALWDKAEEHAVRKQGDMSLAWQTVQGVSEKHLYNFHDRHRIRLVSLRLVGLNLREVPGAIGKHLWSLRSLSLSSNLLTVIPDGLCDLTELNDLNLLRNRLEELPDRFGNLLQLRQLSLAANRLKTIPPSFGNLIRLKRVVLDYNCLRRLPETLGKMRCLSLNVSNNRLAGLPHCLKDMPRLTVLTVVNNGLRSLPSDIGQSMSIRELHLGSNRLTQLPDSICHLKTLRVLWVDHNFIAGLPMRFHELTGLETLLMERNDMVYPPTEVIREGCDRVRMWCSRRLHNRVAARRHTIVMAVQNILKQVWTRGLADPACFEPDVQIGDKGDDHFYALVYERLWDTLLPALERAWQSDPDVPGGTVTSFDYSRDEVDTVLRDYRDPTGRILRTQTQMFKRCSCVDACGRRRVCVPPKIGWMCERKATLIKHNIILEREQMERKRLAMEQEDIDFRVALAKRLVKDRSETIEGKKFYKREAIKVAEELCRKKELGTFKDATDALKAHRRSIVEQKFKKSREALKIARERRLTDLQNKVNPMEEEVKTLRGWAKEQKQAQIEQALRRMDALPEDKQIEELDRQLEQEVEKVEAKAAAAASQIAQKVTKKKVNRGNKEFQDLVDEMVIDLVQQDMENNGTEAREKAEEEHKVLRRIMAMWVGLGMRESFAEWKTWTKRRIKQRRRDARKALREAWHEYEAQGVVGVMAEWKRGFWHERFDVYTDSAYWVHKETGQTRTDPPTAEEFIPEGYELPRPPSKRLEDMSDSTISGDSGNNSNMENSVPSSGGTSSSGPSSGWSLGSGDDISTQGTTSDSDNSNRMRSIASTPTAGSSDAKTGSSQQRASSKKYGSDTSDDDSDNSSKGAGMESGSSSSVSESASREDSDHAESSGKGNNGTSGSGQILRLKDGSVRKSDATTSDPASRQALVAVRSDDSRKSKASTARQSIDKTPKPSTALVTFIKAKAAQIECTVKELVDGSEQRSSLSSSLRTEKSLQRQKDWEVDHARARARRLRQEMVARFKQEEKIRRQLADGQSRSLVASDSYKDTLDEVMSSVGWSPEETYSQEQLTEFAKKAMSQASTLESSSSAGLARFAASPT